MKVETQNNNVTPVQLLFAYDSNLNKSEVSSVIIKTQVNHSDEKLYNNASTLELELDVEMEEDMNIEGWMLNPYYVENDSLENFEVEEEDLAVEPWMTDASMWK